MQVQCKTWLNRIRPRHPGIRNHRILWLMFCHMECCKSAHSSPLLWKSEYWLNKEKTGHRTCDFFPAWYGTPFSFLDKVGVCISVLKQLLSLGRSLQWIRTYLERLHIPGCLSTAYGTKTCISSLVALRNLMLHRERRGSQSVISSLDLCLPTGNFINLVLTPFFKIANSFYWCPLLSLPLLLNYLQNSKSTLRLIQFMFYVMTAPNSSPLSSAFPA